MTYCSQCGTAVEGRFCPQCGAVVAPSGAASGPASPPSAYSTPTGSPGAAASGLTENVAAALCYAVGLITGIIFLVLAPYNQNPRIRFHAFQSIFFHVAFIILSIVFWTIGAMMPFPVSLVMSFGQLLLFPIGLVLWLFLMWKAYQGQTFEIPVIGPIARQQAGA